jgi:hypothetical protein
MNQRSGTGRRRRELLGLSVAVAAILVGGAVVTASGSRPSTTTTPTADRLAAEALSRRTPSPSPSPSPRPRAFISDQHRYVVILPDGWTARRASRADVPDRFDGPDGRQFAVIAVTPPSSGFTDAWLNERVPLRSNAAGQCNRRGQVVPAPFLPNGGIARWTSARIGDLDGRRRMYCGFVNAVAWRDDQAWLLGLGHPWSRTGDLVAFGQLAATFRALPVPSTPTPRPTPRPPGAPTPSPTPVPTPDLSTFTETFTSERFDYTIRYPALWDVAPSEHTWEPDRFRSVSQTVSVSVWPHPDGVSLRDWAKERLRSRLEGSPTNPFCHVGNSMFPVDSLGAILEERVAGRDALVRRQCLSVDAVITVGDRVVVLIVRPRRATSNSLPRSRGTLEAFVATLELPEDD